MKIIVITKPEAIKDEALICNLLFDNGLEILHLRKPGAGPEIYEQFIKSVIPQYRNRIVIHDHYELASHYRLHGIHLKSGMTDVYKTYSDIRHISISCHNMAEISELPFRPAYCFLSPIFDSISKENYKSHYKELPDLAKVTNFPPVIALGGITPGKPELCINAGFSGAAVLGYIWEKPDEAVKRYIRLKTPTVMSIAGFDPSAGAGVMADIKTFEATGAYGKGITSALTFQNEDEYTGTNWPTPEDIKRQCDLQFCKSKPFYVKIGLVESFEILYDLLRYLHTEIPGVKIIWDPILKASAGFVFHTDANKLHDILDLIYLITPNTNELRQLFGETISISELQQLCIHHQLNILWKGGHNEEILAIDRLVTPQGILSFSLQRGRYEKHGTGCVLSSALTSYLAQNLSLEESCRKAQLYVSKFINSNESNLGYHFIKQTQYPTLPLASELKLQYITDFKKGITICDQIEAVCQGGIRWVQLRMKQATDKELLEEGRLAREICRRYNALFIVNDNVDVALQLDADGVHLGKEDMSPVEARKILGPGKIIGATCNSFEDVVLRNHQQVDYIGLGPFTYTTTKENLSPVIGEVGYSTIIKKMQENDIRIPIFAIGGITENDIAALMQTGIQGMALSGLLKNSENITAKTEEIIEIINLSK